MTDPAYDCFVAQFAQSLFRFAFTPQIQSGRGGIGTPRRAVNYSLGNILVSSCFGKIDHLHLSAHATVDTYKILIHSFEHLSGPRVLPIRTQGNQEGISLGRLDIDRVQRFKIALTCCTLRGRRQI